MWQKRINIAIIVLTSLLVVSVVFPLIQHLREAARRTQSENNLKQIGLALYSYHDNYQGFPPGGVFNLEGRGYHGWMTSILPYMDSSPFYSLIDFNQPWDSPTIAGLFLRDDRYYENPSEPNVHRHWEFPIARYSANSHLMAANSFVKLKSIENKEQAFLVGELGGDYLPWGCPYNWRKLDSLNAIPPTYGRSTRDGCHFLFGDGRVEFVSNDASEDVLERMNGEDLSGIEANILNILRPSSFPCPADSLSVSWSGTKGNLVVVRRVIHGNVQSVERGQ